MSCSEVSTAGTFQQEYIGRGSFGTITVAPERPHEAHKTIQTERYTETEGEFMALVRREGAENHLLGGDIVFRDEEQVIIRMPRALNDLLDHVKSVNEGLPLEKVLFYITQILEGMNVMHNLGYAHRDLKLENILMFKDEVLKICDFGMSASLEETKKGSEFQGGSLAYGAPELHKENSSLIDKNARVEAIPLDLWSLGIIFSALRFRCFPWEKAAGKTFLRHFHNQQGIKGTNGYVVEPTPSGALEAHYKRYLRNYNQVAVEAREDHVVYTHLLNIYPGARKPCNWILDEFNRLQQEVAANITNE